LILDRHEVFKYALVLVVRVQKYLDFELWKFKSKLRLWQTFLSMRESLRFVELVLFNKHRHDSLWQCVTF
jgi:hypothetical protein